MDETLQSVSAQPAKLLLLPHRSLSRMGMWLFMAAQSVAAGGFAMLAAWRGNVFAPVFAVLELVVVAVCFSRVWRNSGAGEMITLSATELVVARTDEAVAAVRFHPYWVRLVVQPGRRFGWPSRLLLRSHGREIEIGAFLNEAERAHLARRLSALLAQANGMTSGEVDRRRSS